MKTHRASAVAVGVLYVVGTVAGVLSVVVTRAVLTHADVLAAVAANPFPIRLGAFFILIMGLSLAAMPLFLYPLFKRDNQVVALGMVVFRGAIEGTVYLLFVINWLLLAAVSTSVVNSGTDEASVRTIAGLLVHAHEVVAPVLSFAFIIGASCLYTLFYRTRLIPRWISVWGALALGPYLAAYLLKFFNVSASLDLLYVPLAVQEMVMAIWLIARGFDQAALAELLARNGDRR